MAQGHRPERVGEQIRDELGALLSRGAAHDPGIGFITLTRVTVSADLQIAHVYYTTMGDEKARLATARALERATPFFRRHIGSAIRLRRVPEIDFRFDQSVANQDRVEQILRDLHEEEARRDAERQGVAESAIPADAVPADGAAAASTPPDDDTR
jgi:ribosome-binding factor A